MQSVILDWILEQEKNHLKQINFLSFAVKDGGIWKVCRLDIGSAHFLPLIIVLCL